VNGADVLLAVSLMAVAIEGVVIAAFYTVQLRDQGRIRELTKVVLALADEWKGKTGTEVVMDRQFLDPKADVVLADSNLDDDFTQLPASIGAWGTKG
jgi:hypothetical protein